MAYQPLTILYNPRNAGPSFGQTRITCDCCGRVRSYAEAAQAGWTYDPDGQAFKAFRCGVCTTQPVQDIP